MCLPVKFHSIRSKSAILGGLGLAALTLTGCGGSENPVHPVRGQVLFEGKPTPHALVVLHPINGPKDAPRPRALVAEDGTFRVGTYAEGDGAPPGEYAVTVEWLLTSARKGVDSDAPPSNRLPVRYAAAKTSGLRIVVEPGDNEAPPLNLKR